MVRTRAPTIVIVVREVRRSVSMGANVNELDKELAQFLRRLVGEMTRGDSPRADARGCQVQVTRAVGVERLRRHVRGGSVELDDDALLGPPAVGLYVAALELEGRVELRVGRLWARRKRRKRASSS